jgi:hypothetical protein
VPPGDASGSGGGDIGYICEARREAGVEVWWDSEPDVGCVPDGLLVTFGRGDAGTEFRSGAMLLWCDGRRSCPVESVDYAECVRQLGGAAQTRARMHLDR